MEMAKETCPCSTGCGCPPNITISVTPTTGGQFELAVTKNETIENLKKQISKRLKVPKERICLLHRERYHHFVFVIAKENVLTSCWTVRFLLPFVFLAYLCIIYTSYEYGRSCVLKSHHFVAASRKLIFELPRGGRPELTFFGHYSELALPWNVFHNLVTEEMIIHLHT